MMAYIRGGMPFSIKYVSYNEQKGTAGKVHFVQQAIITISKADKEARRTQTTDATTLNYITKNPNHAQHDTFNIRVMAAGHADVRTVHVPLVREFNGCVVK